MLYGCEKRTMVSFYLILSGIHNIELTTYLALQKTLKPLWDFFPITASECPVSTAMVSPVALIRLFCRFQLRKDAAMVVSVSGHRKNITPKVVLWFHCWGAQVLLTCKCVNYRGQGRKGQEEMHLRSLHWLISLTVRKFCECLAAFLSLQHVGNSVALLCVMTMF